MYPNIYQFCLDTTPAARYAFPSTEVPMLTYAITTSTPVQMGSQQGDNRVQMGARGGRNGVGLGALWGRFGGAFSSQSQAKKNISHSTHNTYKFTPLARFLFVLTLPFPTLLR